MEPAHKKAASAHLSFDQTSLLRGACKEREGLQGDVKSKDKKSQYHGPEAPAFFFSFLAFHSHYRCFPGFDCDYSQYPGPEAQALFFRHYTASEPSPFPHQPTPHIEAGDGAKRSRDSPAGCPVDCSSTAAALLAPPYSSVTSDDLVEARQENGHGQQQQQQQGHQQTQGGISM
eukprot:1161179-Pelagomonas_calceolata.AAC.10